jgi:hypothetical protein
MSSTALREWVTVRVSVKVSALVDENCFQIVSEIVFHRFARRENDLTSQTFISFREAFRSDVVLTFRQLSEWSAQ